jgi:hypothetical protein
LRIIQFLKMKSNSTTTKDGIENLKKDISNEFDLQIADLYFRQLNQNKTTNTFSSPLFAIFLSAFFAIAGTIIGAWLQGQSNLQLERQKYESSIVLKMVDAKTKKEAIENLQFAINLGLIKDDSLRNNIQRAIADSSIRNILTSLAYNAALDDSFARKVSEIAHSKNQDSTTLDNLKKRIDQQIKLIKR